MSGRGQGQASRSRSESAIAALIASIQRIRHPAIRLVLEGDAARVHRRLAAAVIRVALALSLEAPSPSPECPTLARVANALEALPAWIERAGLSSPALIESETFLDADRLGDAVDEEALPALLGAVVDRTPEGGFLPRDPGVIHQELLEIGLTRLGGPSVHFSATDTWVVARDVLSQPPELRSKWVQRTAELPKSTVQRHAAALAAARTAEDVIRAFGTRAGRGTSSGIAGELVVSRSQERRRAGSHYTPPELRRTVVERLLAPLVEGASYETIRALRVCDPAMGAGDFLVEVARYLAGKLLAAASNEGALPTFAPETADPWLATLGVVVRECVHGVDKDPVAVDLARWSLSCLVARASADAPDLSQHLRWGDALVGSSTPSVAQVTQVAQVELGFGGPPSPLGAFDWPAEFPAVLGVGREGFDACVGNPPWVAYAGRAAQPLDPVLARYYERTNAAFHGYRTLHGLFVRRAAELLREGGRLGLVLPTSVADLAGYAPTRAAHDALCDADPDLLDFGDGAFRAVFQPCMALTSTRRARGAPRDPLRGAPWKLARTDLDDVGLRLLERLAALPVLDPALFGERGFQTTGNDLSHLRKLDAPEAPFVVAIREGTDIAEFERHPPRTFLDPNGLTGRLRPLEDYRRVDILIRQTARYPIAALSDGVPFRNSILAGFSNAEWTASALVVYLNSGAVRFYHYTRHRDARQGMPQLKIGHLRALPTVGDPSARARLGAIGERLGKRNSGLTENEREEIDAVVFEALGLSSAERELVRGFAREKPPPKRRTQRAPSETS
jgi:hypothetical protein